MKHLIQMRQQVTSPNFNYLLNGFTEWLETLKKSKSVIKNYPLGLGEYFLYLEKEYGIQHINKVTRQHSEAFITHLQTRTNMNTQYGGISNQTINGIIKAMNSFNKYISDCSQIYKYAITEDYLHVDIAEKIVLTQNEMQELYNATFEPYPRGYSSVEYGQRDRVILALLYGCGLRKGEAVKIDVSDIDFTNKRLLVRNGKGSKQRYVPIPNQHLEDIKAYIQQGRYFFAERCRNQFRKVRINKKYQLNDENALLYSTQGTRLMCFTVRLRYLKDKANIEKNVSAHVLRHSLGTHLYQNGLDLNKIRIILGHSSNDTTQIYVHISKQLEDNENNAA